MKLSKLLLLSILCVTVFSCSSDDDDNDSAVSAVGIWKLTAINLETPFDLNMDGTASTNFMAETDCYQNETILFNADGTGSFNYTSYAEIGIELNMDTNEDPIYTVECIDEIEFDTFNWVQNGNQITNPDDNDPDSSLTISGSQIILLLPGGFYASSPDDDSSVEVTSDITYIYTKQ
ncbi:lipocalin family protein [Sediminibacter sp. Hel_I_10]|uniref:lipocalin family protein n=1 Tax=Sediminibacter sp. Hel_I_10 TaxID=1392490 RepID=UPI000479B842|nr:lipocalin family protein [Sediminibacter sp. Hel_I_10]